MLITQTLEVVKWHIHYASMLLLEAFSEINLEYQVRQNT